jgi:hypothetical protein
VWSFDSISSCLSVFCAGAESASLGSGSSGFVSCFAVFCFAVCLRGDEHTTALFLRSFTFFLHGDERSTAVCVGISSTLFYIPRALLLALLYPKILPRVPPSSTRFLTLSQSAVSLAGAVAGCNLTFLGSELSERVRVAMAEDRRFCNTDVVA